ncbi:PRC-barrel domain-containing protein [Mechercharimyces sp. CAU 1602]|uniref:PRC-barrel domain-containing protein n=1 Tax=Mechercharimyces sp. CAU 1602 TaxID=2973933 RepID=UPI0021613453|nr:PRC-barrel domain-containing protein [Mechercharimyces sp. CAU 1602]MCS1350256.1 PRC-barrel domain-containing protein [Mechercharimyces sp. CAU 1602]
MRSSQDIIGLPVIQRVDGKKLGIVRDLLFDDHQQCYGLLLESGKWVKRGQFIPANRVSALGQDAVMVEDSSAALPLDEAVEESMGFFSGDKKLKGRSVIQATGQELGMVENVYIGEELGKLIGYELSDGLISDLTEGRKVLHSHQPLTWGEDVLIAPSVGIELVDNRRR